LLHKVLTVLVRGLVADPHFHQDDEAVDSLADEVEVVEVEEAGKILILYLHFFRKCLY
jgi:hypothetical protein